MNGLYLLLFIQFFLFCQSVTESGQEFSSCVNQDGKGKDLVSVRIKRDESGEWSTAISADEESKSLPNGTEVNLNRKIIECDGKEVIRIQANIKVPNGKTQHQGLPLDSRIGESERLLFHQKGGKNIVVSNNGLTATRINEEAEAGYGGILTNRPLGDGELFEVKLGKHITKYADSLGIGVTRDTPATADYLFWMSSRTIILYDHQLYDNGIIINKKYGSNLRFLGAGDRVGVMKKSNGDLHVLINGIDQGVAKSNINYPVHGVIDLYGNTVQATLI